MNQLVIHSKGGMFMKKWQKSIMEYLMIALLNSVFLANIMVKLYMKKVLEVLIKSC